MSYRDDFARLQRFFARSIETITVNGVRFYVNPQRWSEDTESIYVETVTAAGIGYFDFGIRPSVYSFYGTTGIGGLDELRRMKSFEIRARSGPARPVVITYPNAWDHARSMYLTRFRKEVNADDGALYYWYTIEAREMPAGGASFVHLPDSANVGTYLPPGG